MHPSTRASIWAQTTRDRVFELPLFTSNQGFGPLWPDWHDKLLHTRRVYGKNTDEEKKGAPFLLILVEPG